LRDDVKILIESLQDLYETKLSLLQKLHKATASKLYYCKTGDYNRLSDAIEEDDDAMGTIDLLDFNISRTMAELSRVMGIRRSSLIAVLKMGIHPLYRTLLNTMDELTLLLSACARDHDELLREMESKRDEIEKARRSLASHLRISRLCRKFSA